MNYHTSAEIANVHFTHVTPLDARIVVLKASARIPGYGTTHTDSALGLFGSLLMTGTKKHPKKLFETYLKKHAITLDIKTDREYVHFTILVRNTHLRYALHILTELIGDPALPLHEYEHKITTAREEHREAYDDAKRRTHINFLRHLYPKHSYLRASSLDEIKNDLDAMQYGRIDKIVSDALHGEWYVTLVGDALAAKDLQPFLKLLSRRSSSVSYSVNSDTILPSKSYFETVPGKTNVEIRMGNILPITMKDDLYVPCSFGLAVLGKVGGFSGRLMSTVREKEGLTYGIYAHAVHPHALSTGYWNIFTFFTAKDLTQGITSTKRELTHLVEKGITEKEIITFKAIYENQLLIAHDSNSKRANLYHRTALVGERGDDIWNTLSRIQSLGKREVNNAVKQCLLPEALIVCGSGPVTKNGEGIVAVQGGG